MRNAELDILGVTYVKVPTRKGASYYWTPKFITGADAGKEFSAHAELEDAHVFLSSGMVHHEVDRSEGGQSGLSRAERTAAKPSGFVADDLRVFDEHEWRVECEAVLRAHRWINADSKPNKRVLAQALKNWSPGTVRSLKSKCPEHYHFFLLQHFAVQNARPLSRLWYAVNMLSLFYCQQDLLRVGYLWAEYQARLRHEGDALRGKKSLQSARAGGLQRSLAINSASAKTLATMSRYIAEHHSVANAARLAFQSGHGTSVEANRKLWNRHRKK